MNMNPDPTAADVERAFIERGLTPAEIEYVRGGWRDPADMLDIIELIANSEQRPEPPKWPARDYAGESGEHEISESPTDAQLSAWAQRQRQEHRDGKLTSRQVEKLESIPGWTWDED